MFRDPELVLAATVEPQSGPDGCRLDSPRRYAVVEIRRSYTGFQDHEFMVSAGTRDQEPSDFVLGVTLDLAEAAGVMDLWQAGTPVSAVLDRYPFMIAKRVADKQRQQSAPGEWSWQGYLHPHYVMTRREMVPMLFAASKQPRLRTLFPLTSMFNLCFKDPFDPSWPHHLPSIELVEKSPARYAVVKGKPRVELARGELAPMIDLLVTEVEQVFGPVDAN